VDSTAISALILTLNEAANIERTLAPLARFRRVVVVDSGSSDGTLDLIARHPNAVVVQRRFDTHATQWNFGLGRPEVETEWVLALDADYLIEESLLDEIDRLNPSDDIGGYRARFRYCISGRPIRCGIYPPSVVLFRKAVASYVQDGHTQRVVVVGRIVELDGRILHDDRKPLARWLESQHGYARLEAANLRTAERSSLGTADRLRLTMCLAPPCVFVYLFFARGGFLDGWRGLYYAMQRSFAEMLLALELLDQRLRDGSGEGRR